MRIYPNNSPLAAARIVALTMLADGDACKAEIDILERQPKLIKRSVKHV